MLKSKKMVFAATIATMFTTASVAADFTGTAEKVVDGKVIWSIHTYQVGKTFSPISHTSEPIPAEYADLYSSGISTVNLDSAILFALPIGELANISLFDRHFALVHERDISHSNGDKTWIGSVDGDGRAIITFGKDGSAFGTITEADGRSYSIETANNGSSIAIDNESAGRIMPSLEHDMLSGDSHAMLNAAANQAASIATTISNTALAAGITTTPKTVIDLLIVYSSTLPNAATRINQLVATTNQAYADSGLTDISVRVVYSYSITYADANANSSALTLFATNSGVFKDVNSTKAKYGADVAIYLRPLKAVAQGSCGVSYANGANGTLLQASKGYAVVSDGTDGSYYCYNTTLAHEIGHVLGAVHDVEHSGGVKGAFPYAFGYGINNAYGDIMSYYNPQIAKFATPTLVAMTNAKGVKYYLGADGTADIVRTFKQTAPIVAAFAPSITK
jgi:hypothetical protein